jgi:anti-sigma factor RsiW
MDDGIIKATVMFTMRPRIGSCKQTMARMSGHLDHDLPAGHERRVVRHLARCHRCRAVYDSLTRAVDQVRGLGRSDLERPAPSVADVVTKRIRRE